MHDGSAAVVRKVQESQIWVERLSGKKTILTSPAKLRLLCLEDQYFLSKDRDKKKHKDWRLPGAEEPLGYGDAGDTPDTAFDDLPSKQAMKQGINTEVTENAAILSYYYDYPAWYPKIHPGPNSDPEVTKERIVDILRRFVGAEIYEAKSKKKKKKITYERFAKKFTEMYRRAFAHNPDEFVVRAAYKERSKFLRRGKRPEHRAVLMSSPSNLGISKNGG